MFATYVFYSCGSTPARPPGWRSRVAVLGRRAAHRRRHRPAALRRLGRAPAPPLRRRLARAARGPAGLAHRHLRRRHRPVDPIFPTGTFRLPASTSATTRSRRRRGHRLAAAWPWRCSSAAPDLGLQTRAVVDDRDLTALDGVDAGRVTSAPGCSAAPSPPCPASCSRPFLGLDAVILTLLVIQAFGARRRRPAHQPPADLRRRHGHRRRRLVATKFVVDPAGLAGLPTSLPFIVLFAVLVFSPGKGSSPGPGRAPTAGPRRGSGRRRMPLPGLAPASARRAAPCCSRAVARRRPAAHRHRRRWPSCSSSPASACSSACPARCRCATPCSWCSGPRRWPTSRTPASPTCWRCSSAGLGLVPVGALVAIPAIRLSGLFLALATFGFGILAQNLLFGTRVGLRRHGARDAGPARVFGVSFTGRHGLLLLRPGRGRRRRRRRRGRRGSPASAGSCGRWPTRPLAVESLGRQPHRLPGARLLPSPPSWPPSPAACSAR